MNETQTLTLEAGKYYRTRDGRKALIVGMNPFEGQENREAVGFIQGLGGVSWRRDGHYFNADIDDRDIVEALNGEAA